MNESTEFFTIDGPNRESNIDLKYVRGMVSVTPLADFDVLTLDDQIDSLN